MTLFLTLGPESETGLSFGLGKRFGRVRRAVQSEVEGVLVKPPVGLEKQVS